MASQEVSERFLKFKWGARAAKKSRVLTEMIGYLFIDSSPGTLPIISLLMRLLPWPQRPALTDHQSQIKIINIIENNHHIELPWALEADGINSAGAVEIPWRK